MHSSNCRQTLTIDYRQVIFICFVPGFKIIWMDFAKNRILIGGKIWL